MKNHFLLASTVAWILLAMAAAQDSAPKPREDADRVELLRLETLWNAAHQAGDAEALDRIWAHDLEVAVPKMPVMTKSDALRFFKSARMKFSRYQTSELRLRIYDRAAVVTGRLQRSRTMKGREMDDDWRFTKVYVKRAGQWRVVAFHASEAAQPAQP